MSNSPKAATHAGIGDVNKKRKRKRNNKSKTHAGPSESTAVTHGVGKKIKFDEIERESILNEDTKLLTASPDSSAKEGLPTKFDNDLVASIRNSSSSPNPSQKPHTHHKHKNTKKEPRFKSSGPPKSVGFFEKYDEDDETYHGNVRINKASLHQKARELLDTRKSLPIYQHKEDILKYYTSNQVVVVIGETGSGKSTQIPQFLMPINSKQIAVTQPRRVAAASLAKRVSEEYGCALGEEVGYQVRFANVTNPKTTKLKFLTDGMLLREIMIDSTLAKYSTIIIDEAHERTILTDMILGFLKQILLSKKRPDLRIIVMSATLNAELFSKFFDNSPILFVEGRTYPVSKFYLEDDSEDIVDTVVRAAIQINMSEQEGDILCFLPGQEEIENAVNVLLNLSPLLPKEAPLIVPLPLYAALSPSQQLKIFDKLPSNQRKIILATNIAETSITVSGVRYVIDSGLRKIKVWKHELGLSTLLTTTISQASAKQRAGRAGREAPGKVFRLYLEKVFNNQLVKQQEAEIARNDIVLPVLTLKNLGVNDLVNWPWLEHPGNESILSALSTLYSLRALDDDGHITSLGRRMAILPLPPQLSVVLITAMDTGVLKDVIDIVACLSVDNLLLNVGGSDGEQRDEINFKRRNYCPLGCQHGDLIALKEYFDYYTELVNDGKQDEAREWCKELHFSFRGFKNVTRVKTQLKDYMVSTIKQDSSLSSDAKEKTLANLRSQLQIDDDEGLVKQPLDIKGILTSFIKGFITNTAIGLPDRSYRTFTSGQLVSIHPSSNLFGKSNLDAIMYIEYVFTAKGYARTCSSIELSWIQEAAPQYLGGAKISATE